MYKFQVSVASVLTTHWCWYGFN